MTEMQVCGTVNGGVNPSGSAGRKNPPGRLSVLGERESNQSCTWFIPTGYSSFRRGVGIASPAIPIATPNPHVRRDRPGDQGSQGYIEPGMFQTGVLNSDGLSASIENPNGQCARARQTPAATHALHTSDPLPTCVTLNRRENGRAIRDLHCQTAPQPQVAGLERMCAFAANQGYTEVSAYARVYLE